MRPADAIMILLATILFANVVGCSCGPTTFADANSRGDINISERTRSLEDFPSVRIWTPRSGGSGVSLGSGLILLSCHQVHNEISEAEFSGISHRFDVIPIGSTDADSQIIATGASAIDHVVADSSQDWALIRLHGDPSHLPTVDYRPDLRIRAGDTIYLVGYPLLGRAISAEDGKSIERTVVEATVINNGCIGDYSSREDVIFCMPTGKGNEELDLIGMSGGPAVAFDPISGEAVVIGISVAGAPALMQIDLFRSKRIMPYIIIRPDLDQWLPRTDTRQSAQQAQPPAFSPEPPRRPFPPPAQRPR